jgi:hypothetical protein
MRTRNAAGNETNRSGGASRKLSPSRPTGIVAPERTSNSRADHWRRPSALENGLRRLKAETERQRLES